MASSGEEVASFILSTQALRIVTSHILSEQELGAFSIQKKCSVVADGKSDRRRLACLCEEPWRTAPSKGHSENPPQSPFREKERTHRLQTARAATMIRLSLRAKESRRQEIIETRNIAESSIEAQFL